MKGFLLTGLVLLFPVAALAQSGPLSAELEALHAKWFKAFDAGDGAAMDQMEVENLVLVMPTGMAWSKSGPRRDHRQERDDRRVRAPRRKVADCVRPVDTGCADEMIND